MISDKFLVFGNKWDPIRELYIGFSLLKAFDRNLFHFLSKISAIDFSCYLPWSAVEQGVQS